MFSLLLLIYFLKVSVDELFTSYNLNLGEKLKSVPFNNKELLPKLFVTLKMLSLRSERLFTVQC